MEHLPSLSDAGPAEIGPARALIDRTYAPLGNATWPAVGPDPYSPPFCCGHGWTMMPLESMLGFVTEQIYSVRQYSRDHPTTPRGRLGFSWQPTNNFDLPAAQWDSAKRQIASRIGAAIRGRVRPRRDRPGRRVRGAERLRGVPAARWVARGDGRRELVPRHECARRRVHGLWEAFQSWH